jgi:hypothetical protein
MEYKMTKELVDTFIQDLELDPNNERALVSLKVALLKTYNEKVTAIIPSKSNTSGLITVVESLMTDPAVEQIVVVADGPQALQRYREILHPYSKVLLTQVRLASGIHVMWNIGLNIARGHGNTPIFINDDIIPGPNSCGLLAALLAHNSEYGVICPDYDGRVFTELVHPVSEVCGARYDGTGGLGGFFMALNKNLAKEFTFDERMKWYYGDDDIMRWCKSKGRIAGIARVATCRGNTSFTIIHDRPENFNEDTMNDERVFRAKWGL